MKYLKNNSSVFLFLLFSAGIAIFSPNIVFADTTISGGVIDADTIWIKANSPYIIRKNISVAEGITLTIDPGVVVKIEYDTYIDVFGKLIIAGTASEKVIITSLVPEDGWGGITVTDGGSYEIRNANISNAWEVLWSYQSQGIISATNISDSYYGVDIDESTLDVDTSNFNNIYQSALDVFSNSTLNISSSNIEDMYSAGVDLNWHSTLNLSNSNIEASDIGVNLYNYSEAIITNTKIKDNSIAFEVGNNSTISISNSEIANTSARYAVDIYNNSHFSFASSSMLNTLGEYAIVIFNSTVDIKDSVLDTGVGNGLKISGALFAKIQNTIIRNFFNTGLAVSAGAGMKVFDSEISHNDYGIKDYKAELEIVNSKIVNNQSFGVYNDPGIYDTPPRPTPMIKAGGNWWGDVSGPYNELTNATSTGNQVSSNVEYSPWLTADPTVIKPTRNPVIIIPGILSSYLNKNEFGKPEVWMNLLKALGIGDDSYLDELALDVLGQPDLSHPVMLPTDIFRKIKDKDFFDGLINELKNSGYVENEDLFVFPYDWRLNIVSNVDDLYSPLLTTLKDKVDQVLAQTGAKKVDIVAHSMGGFLAKYYIEHYGQGKVDKFVDIATPHLGAPSTFTTLMYGDNLGIKFGWFGLNPLEIKKISQNSPAVYQLLPSANYFSTSLPDYNYYVYDMDDYDSDGVRGKLSYDQSLDFLKNTGRNDLVMNNVVNIHNDLDQMNPADYGVKTYNIVGCGTPTLGKIFTLGKQNDKDPQYDIAYISGDGTVPQRSAEAVPSLEQYYTSKANHGTMPSASGIKELVSSLLAGTESSFDFVFSPNISTTTKNCPLPNGTFLGFHSPVNVNIYDGAGNHTGPNADGDLEENIPNIAYDIIDGNKFAYLPDGENYRIELQATGVGSFSAHIKKIADGEVISTSYFSDIPLADTSTTAEVNIGGSEPTIILDSTGDGTNKETVNPSVVLAGDSLQDLIAPVTDLTIILPATSTDGVYYGDVSFILSATDTDSGILKSEYSLTEEGDYLEATSTIIISNIGTSTIFYRSVDKAGNIENPKSIIIIIGEVVIAPTPDPVPEPTPDPVSPVVTSHSTRGSSHSASPIPPVLASIPATEEGPMISPPTAVLASIPASVTRPVNKEVSIKSSVVAVATPTSSATSAPGIPLTASVGSVGGNVKPIILVISGVILLGVLVFINKKYIMKA